MSKLDALILNADPFPPLVFKTHYDGFSDSGRWTEICEGIMRGAGGHNSYLEAGGAQSSVRNQTSAPHTLAVFQPFYRWLWPKIEEVLFLQWGLESEVKYWISDSWVNCHDRGGKTLEHTHGYASMAVSTYITVPENSGNLEVLDPCEPMWAMHFRSHYRERAPSGWRPIEIKAGDVCMFPGWLQHRTEEHRGAKGDIRWVLTTNILCVNHSRSNRGNQWHPDGL
jgi:uncharacterized protein (TIGR02466 family)